MKAANLNNLWAKLIVEELFRNGITHFYLSPGSRSTPLVLAVAERSDLTVSMHFDERGSAFRALGYGKATNRPAVLVCTSGTALANFYPAIIEASQSATPMIILSADRPAELRNSGAPQTIDQVKIFGKYLRWEFDLIPPNLQVPAEFVLSTVDKAVASCDSGTSGPVQINCQYRELLAPDGSLEDYSAYVKTTGRWHGGNQPFSNMARTANEVIPSDIEAVLHSARKSERGVLVAGTIPVGTDVSPLIDLAERWGWPLITDICSGVRTCSRASDNVISHSDLYLRNEKVAASLSPDMIVQFGNPPISKALNRYIAEFDGTYIIIAHHSLPNDPHHKATMRIQASVAQVATCLAKSDLPIGSQLVEDFRSMEVSAKNVISEHHDEQSGSTSELAAVFEVFRSTKASRGVFLATSMPIREANMVLGQTDIAIPIHANRGANGIDGTIATAVGFADGLQMPVTLIIGDLAALHDLNSLSMAAGAEYPVNIVVLNNDGGGIFSFLPIAEQETYFEKCFGTPHGFNFQNAAEMFGIKYHNPHSTKDLGVVYRHSLKSNRPSIIELNCDRRQNLHEHRRLWKAIEKRIEKETVS